MMSCLLGQVKRLERLRDNQNIINIFKFIFIVKSITDVPAPLPHTESQRERGVGRD